MAPFSPTTAANSMIPTSSLLDIKLFDTPDHKTLYLILALSLTTLLLLLRYLIAREFRHEYEYIPSMNIPSISYNTITEPTTNAPTSTTPASIPTTTTTAVSYTIPTITPNPSKPTPLPTTTTTYTTDPTSKATTATTTTTTTTSTNPTITVTTTTSTSTSTPTPTSESPSSVLQEQEQEQPNERTSLLTTTPLHTASRNTGLKTSSSVVIAVDGVVVHSSRRSGDRDAVK